ncbi:hypothetical protein CHGG_06116 [Chaetomium globosum CBS 148.51]|uniref:C2H2-type domain-containing protein n=1 Tax=Chaetomium globosum (strain ATCC 6205 / CBS 148.51 / DSM 1962 / NBRC 6347 / NRRL 1970) TaxID=306901 RepID=Q2H5E9_CHAGB|nr:uncharacterized protein CHGG_06116 [Chaetomium globosum CBS 148.51]EAQ89497.1 hypothetical protein CHGG_06116 [Chaetomium globosum CBS 148.51]
MDPFRDPPADSLAAARLHVQALTDCGLSREALLRALLENYGDNGNAAMAGMDTSSPQLAAQQGQQVVQEKRSHQPFHNTRLSVSTTSSKSSGRASVLSTATSMSSVSSQGGLGGGVQELSATPLPAPPAPPVKSNNRGSSKPQGAYWCTFCDVAFQRKFDWKRHEDEFHERYKRYPCPNCNRIFWGANTFNQHHKNAHGCTTCPHAERVVKYTQKKTAWACGFCGGFLASRDRYFDHIARHYEDGCNKSHWNHSLVIYGLLHQPTISQAWKDLDSELYGHLPRNQQPMLEWDPKSTGHAQGFLEGESPGKLQDLLEFFSESRDDPKFLARLAHDSATIRLRTEVQPTVAPVPPPTSSSSRPISEPPKHKAVMKSSPLTKHMSTPQAPPPPPPTAYDDEPFPKKQRNIAPLPSMFPKNNPFFSPQPPPPTQQNQQQPEPQQQPLPQQPPPQAVISPYGQPMMSPAGTGGYYDLAVTHVHPHMQLLSQMTPQQQHQIQQQLQHQQHQQHQQQQPQQSHLMSPPMNVYDDWSSLAGTVVDESVFANALAMGWQQQQQQHQADMGRGHPGTG